MWNFPHLAQTQNVEYSTLFLNFYNWRHSLQINFPPPQPKLLDSLKSLAVVEEKSKIPSQQKLQGQYALKCFHVRNTKLFSINSFTLLHLI